MKHTMAIGTSAVDAAWLERMAVTSSVKKMIRAAKGDDDEFRSARTRALDK